MFPLLEFRSALERIVSILEGLEVKFLVTGGAAAIGYGEPRTTQVFDLVVPADSLKAQLAAFLQQAQGQRFLFDDRSVRAAVEAGRPFQMLDLDSAMKFDLYPRELVPGELGRAVQIELMPGFVLPVASLPDLVVSKLIWIRHGSHKSRRDVRQILRRADDDESNAIRERVGLMNLASLLEEVLSESDEINV